MGWGGKVLSLPKGGVNVSSEEKVKKLALLFI